MNHERLLSWLLITLGVLVVAYLIYALYFIFG